MYYTVLDEEHTHYCKCKQEINWNLLDITGSNEATGYIVQHFMRRANPRQNFLDDADYYEAWKIENGISVDRGNICDDLFSVGDWSIYGYPTADMANSIGTKGSFVFTGDVYWIPEGNSELYRIVESWSITSVPQANGLKASYSFEKLSTVKPVFSREPFIHTWDYSTPELFQEEVSDFLFRLCPKREKRDTEIFEENLDDIFSKGLFLDVKEKISKAWYNTDEEEKS